MDSVIGSRWKSFAVRFAIYFPLFMVSRLLFGAGLLRFLVAFGIGRWIDPVRRAKARRKQDMSLGTVFR